MKNAYGDIYFPYEEKIYGKLYKHKIFKICEENYISKYSEWKVHIKKLLENIDEKEKENFFRYIINNMRNRKARTITNKMVYGAMFTAVFSLIFSLMNNIKAFNVWKWTIVLSAVIIIGSIAILSVALFSLSKDIVKNSYKYYFYEDLVEIMKEDKKWSYIIKGYEDKKCSCV